MTNEMQHFIQEAIDRIADGIRGQWTVRDEAFLKNIISDGLQPLRVEIENFEAIERERDLLKDDQATITTLRERLAAAEAMIHDAVMFAQEYQRKNAKWTGRNGIEQDPSGVHEWLETYYAGWLKPQPQAETAEQA